LCGRFEHLQFLIETCDPGGTASAPLRVAAKSVHLAAHESRPADTAGASKAGASSAAPGRWLGLAIDTCHLFAAGYDLRTRAALDETLGRLDEAVGLARVAVVHANDAKGGLGSGLDRHEHIGRGKLGRETFRLLVNHPALQALPFILETPKEDPRGRKMDPVNLRLLRRLVAKPG
jgi:hypothetical protein